MEFFFILALFFYVAGHRVKEVRPDATVPQYFRKLIKPPKYIYFRTYARCIRTSGDLICWRK
jgi:hypothetical protein